MGNPQKDNFHNLILGIDKKVYLDTLTVGLNPFLNDEFCLTMEVFWDENGLGFSEVRTQTFLTKF